MAKARAGSDDGTSSKKRTAKRGRVTPSSGRATPTSGRAMPTSGRTTPPKSRDVNKRYTAPIPKSVRHSPGWYGPLLLVLLVAGLLVIVGNYVGIMPGGTSNWYLVGGLAGIVVGAMMATRYH
ncbi:MAG: cell division protein CrgA [Acidimicrobiales bacterium]